MKFLLRREWPGRSVLTNGKRFKSLLVNNFFLGGGGVGLPYGSESDQKNGQVTGLKKKLWMKQQFSNRYSSHLNQKQKVFFIYKKKNFNKKNPLPESIPGVFKYINLFFHLAGMQVSMCWIARTNGRGNYYLCLIPQSINVKLISVLATTMSFHKGNS